MDISKEGDKNNNIHALRWEVYVKDKEELIKREFLEYVLYPKGGNIVWICVKDNITG